MKTELFDYHLPPGMIAQNPVVPRDTSRLMVLDRNSGQISHRHFYDIGEYLEPGDLMVANNSRVLPARLTARKPTGGVVEILLLQSTAATDEWQNEPDTWECLIRGRNIGPGMVLTVDTGDSDRQLFGVVETVDADSGTRTIRFNESPLIELDAFGQVPLPPYVTSFSGEPEQYQTVYSNTDGSVAAPTAGLHFTPDLLVALHRQGIHFETVTLHVGSDTFRPVESEEIEDHHIHTEKASLSSATARRINDTVLQGKRVVAVGTTTVRTLEWAATRAQGIDPYDDSLCPWQRTAAFDGPVDLFIRSGYRFRAVDTLITNFHLPQSSLLMLVSAFVGQGRTDIDEGRRIVLQAYEEAKNEGYRFFSFGDAMLIL